MKSKKILTILLSLAIMFTFMPAMAFAADHPTSANDFSQTAIWSNNFGKATNSVGTKKSYDTYERLYNPNYGVVVATAGNDNITGVENPEYAVTSYIDGSKAAIKANDNWSFTTFKNMLNSSGDALAVTTGISLMMNKPDNATYYPSFIPATYDGVTTFEQAAEQLGKGGKYTVTYSVTGFDATKKLEDQQVTLTASVTVADTVTDPAEVNALNELIVGGVSATKTITVKAEEATFADVQIDVDKITKNSPSATDAFAKEQDYDGATHKIVTSSVDGITAAWKLQDNKTKKYNDATSIEFKDAGTYNFALVLTNKSGTSQTYYKSVVVDVAGHVHVDFDDSSYYITGTEFDPWDFVEVTTCGGDDAANKKAVEADKAALKEAVKSVCEITQTPDKYDAEKIALKLAPKSDYDAEAFFKANKALFANFNATEQPFYDLEDSAVVYINQGGKRDDITFSGVTTKSYKAKKKTKKLAKAKSFTIVATADSGKDVTYSMTSSSAKITINKTTGKVTVKKGLKKGTYTLKIKAKTAAGLGYRAAKETVTVKVKIK